MSLVDQSAESSDGGAGTVGIDLPRQWFVGSTSAPARTPRQGQESCREVERLPTGADQRLGGVERSPAAAEDLSAAVGEAQRGDEDAFRMIYRAVQPGLLRYLRALVGEDAEDVASEAWLQIARDLPSLQGDIDGFRGWAATIARHRALDHLRRQRRRPQLGAPFEHMVDMAADDDTAGRALEAVSTDAALKMIAALPRDQAEAVLLRVVMGLDAKTAGRVLGKRAGAVRTAAYRGLRRLAEQVGQPGDGVVDGTAQGHPRLPSQ
nr:MULTISPECIES: RNA polymerase sigma factor [unclassified Frankia]